MYSPVVQSDTGPFVTITGTGWWLEAECLSPAGWSSEMLGGGRDSKLVAQLYQPVLLFPVIL